jgi:hypothetical protein
MIGLAAAVVTQAQNAGSSPLPIGYGETANGALTNDSPAAHYSFTGQAGDVVTITLSSDDFDAFLVLQDASGKQIASDDDGGGSLNSEIHQFALPASGTYTIVVDSTRHHADPSSFATGKFTLSLQTGRLSAVPTVTPFLGRATETQVPIAAGTLEPGSTLHGTLSSASPAATYYFAGTAGESVTLGLASDDFDAFLRLSDSSGKVLAEDDDTGGGLNAQIAYTLSSDGTYSVTATSSGGNSIGSFTLSMNSENMSAAITATVIIAPAIIPSGTPSASTSGARRIEYTQQVEGRLSSDQPSVDYTFRGQSGDVIAITMASPDFDAYITLAETTGDYNLSSSYSSGANNAAVLGPYTLPDTGDYTVTATSFYGDGIGTFTLRIDKVQVTSIKYGDTARVTVGGRTSTQYLTFNGKVGDALDILVDSGGTVDTNLSVIGPSGYELTSDDDSGRGFDPEINRLVLTEEGIYYLWLQTVDSASGQVSVSLQSSPVASLDSGPQTIRLNDKHQSDVVTFSGTAGEKVRLTFNLTLGTSMSPSITVSQNGDTVSSVSASSLTSVSLEFTIPQDGKATVAIEDYPSSPEIIEIALERLK